MFKKKKKGETSEKKSKSTTDEKNTVADSISGNKTLIWGANQNQNSSTKGITTPNWTASQNQNSSGKTTTSFSTQSSSVSVNHTFSAKTTRSFSSSWVATSSSITGNKISALTNSTFQPRQSLFNDSLLKPPANQPGYQSPFTRKLKPFEIDAKPFPISSTSQALSNFPRSTPIYTSYRSSPTNASSNLTTSSSTHSLPVATEPSKLKDPRIPTYDTDGKKRGKVLVINNINFLKDKQQRKGAEMDEKNLNTVFRKMGFDVDTFRDLKQSDMLNKVMKFKNNSDLKKVDISIVIMMSHGSNFDEHGKIVGGGFTQIYGIDDEGLPIDKVLDQFSAESCPAMAGKPKIFIFQCCRGETTETLHVDAAPIKKMVKKHADMLIAFSTLPGFFAMRDITQGSWYIQSICEVFKAHAKDFDVETLLKIVDEQLSQKHPQYKQTSTYESRGFKRCYLNPK